MNEDSVIERFRAAMRAAGIVPPEHIEADGQIHRCNVDARNGKGDGAYVLHLDGIPAGGFQNWQSGEWQDWCARESLTAGDREQLRMKVEQSRRQREADAAQRQAQALGRAAELWATAVPAPSDHPYLVRKNVKPHGLRVQSGNLKIAGMDCDGALVVPLRDTAGQLHSVEFIAANGEKRYLPGGRVTGCYCSIGKPVGTVVIAEGYATGASIHEATGYAVACALSAGNLEPVATSLREKLPDVRIVLAADNDASGDTNVGVDKARSAARTCGGCITIPDAGGATADFNDVFLKHGAQAVRAAIEGAQPLPPDIAANSELPLTVALRRASEIEMEPVSWLWSGWLAAGKLHVLAGMPGTGKTTIALALAAVVTSGGRWPDGEQFSNRGAVLMWSGEDDAADTLVPRLAAMGADLNRVHFVGECSDPDGKRPFDPAHDMPALIATARAVGDVRLLIVDPIVTTVAGDSHKNAEVRRGLAPLVTFGHELRAAVLGISHFSKGTGGRDPLDRITGSLAFGALARLVFGAAKQMGEDDTELGRVLVRIKSNIGPDGGAIAYSLASAELEQGILTSRIAWGTTIEGSARDILADAEQINEDGGRTQRDEAGEFLRTMLANGPLKAAKVLREARDAGHAEKTIRRAAKDLGVRPMKESMGGGWMWKLPNTATSPEDGHTKTVATFEGVGHLRDSEAF